jgi:hypothetical protein
MPKLKGMIVTKKSLYLCVFGLLTLCLNERMAMAQAESAAATAPICHECISIRVGVPMIEQGLAGTIADDKFTEIQLPNRLFRGFTAAGETFAIEGHSPEDMRGPLHKVLGRGTAGTYDSCGQWLQHAELAGKTVLGWVHNESDCNYQIGQTHMSESLSVSNDYGLTWTNLGLIIRGTDPPAVHRMTGEGGCTAVNGQTDITMPIAHVQRTEHTSWRARRYPTLGPAIG